MVDRSSGFGKAKITSAMAATTPTGASGAARHGLAFSASAAVRRSNSVRRRLDLNDDGLSPKARRTEAYVTPPDVPMQTTMTVDALTQELAITKGAVAQLHKYVVDIAGVVDNHAEAIDGVSSEMAVTKGKLAAFERRLTEGFAGAANKLTETFGKMAAIVSTVPSETTMTAADLAAKMAQCEASLAALNAREPLPPGLGAGAGGAGPADPFRSAASGELKSVADKVEQLEVQMAHFKAHAAGLESGAAQIAGRVVAVETELKRRASETTQAQPGIPDPWAQARAGAAAAAGQQVPQPTPNVAGPPGGQPQGPGQGVGASYFPTTPGASLEKAPYNPHWKFDTKLSNDLRFQYDPKDTKAWLTKVNNYFMGQCPDAATLLRWAESRGKTEITSSEVKSCAGSLCLDADPIGDLVLATDPLDGKRDA